MRAKVTYVVEFEMGAPDDYPDEVKTWDEALQLELGELSVEHEGGADLSLTVDGEFFGDVAREPFKRRDA